jgi:hypothetical protein
MKGCGMPYITQARRKSLVSNGEDFSPPRTPGELNYMFTLLAKGYLIENGLSYQAINDILGAFEGAKLEFYRRMAVPYESTKIEENGDVYDGQPPSR